MATHALTADRGHRMVHRYAGQKGQEQLSREMRVSAGSEEFQATMVSIPIDEVTIEEATMSPSVIERTREHLRASPADLVRVMLIVEGDARFRSGDADFRLSEGQMVAFAMTAPFRLDLETRVRHRTLIVPTRLLHIVAGRIDTIARQPILPSPARGRLVSAMNGLSRHAPRDNTEEAELVAHALVDLVRSVIRSHGRGLSPSVDDDLRREVYALIAARHSDPDLRPTAIAGQLNISLRTLHRLFAEEPRKLADVIRGCRVDALSRALQTSTEPFTVLARRAGFGSPDSAYRAFKELRGATPSRYRAELTAPHLMPASPANRALGDRSTYRSD
ncbi:AraC-like ligand-binding domain-containing protein [Microbacterium sp. NPDC055683]